MIRNVPREGEIPEKWRIDVNNSVNGYLGGSKDPITEATTLSTQGIILCDATGGAFTVTLPPASKSFETQYLVKKIDSSVNAVTIDGNASETIDGATTVALSSQYDVRGIYCDGSNWHVVRKV